jgi:hypothetical protein
MSDPLRIALVAEGPTDAVVIEAVLRAILGQRSFVLNQLQPESSLAFGPFGGGWVGVYRWCRQAARRGNGQLQHDALVFANYDLLLLHLDADVAGDKYEDGSITALPTDGALPCERPCPPATASTNALRAVLLSWCGEIAEPQQVVICRPSKSTEAWVIAALFPTDRSVKQGIECYPNPESRLSQQPKAKRIRKTKRDYEDQSKAIEAAWSKVATLTVAGEAYRFQGELLAKLQLVGG